MPVINPPRIEILDEGVSQGRVTRQNFVGSVVASVAGETATITVSGGSASIKQTEIDFGTVGVAEASFNVVDVDVTPTSNLIGSVAYEAPTGKDLDELEMDGLDLKFGAGSGAFDVYARGLDGYVAGAFKLNYMVG